MQDTNIIHLDAINVLNSEILVLLLRKVYGEEGAREKVHEAALAARAALDKSIREVLDNTELTEDQRSTIVRRNLALMEFISHYAAEYMPKEGTNGD